MHIGTRCRLDLICEMKDSAGKSCAESRVRVAEKVLMGALLKIYLLRPKTNTDNK
jgi:hypothetical protein